MATRLDDKYYEAIRSHSAAERLLIRARDDIFAKFMASCAPSEETTILDVGVSDVVNDGANVLERRYPWRSQITACGLGTAEEFKTAFPESIYVRIAANERLPFDDGQFGIATSNAVLEHVGSRENQAFFVSELCRVAHKVFITVPNRYFPVEPHTGIPILHYNLALFSLACRAIGKRHWAHPSNLMLMSRRDLQKLIPVALRDKIRTEYAGILAGVFSSNIALIKS